MTKDTVINKSNILKWEDFYSWIKKELKKDKNNSLNLLDDFKLKFLYETCKEKPMDTKIFFNDLILYLIK